MSVPNNEVAQHYSIYRTSQRAVPWPSTYRTLNIFKLISFSIPTSYKKKNLQLTAASYPSYLSCSIIPNKIFQFWNLSSFMFYCTFVFIACAVSLMTITTSQFSLFQVMVTDINSKQLVQIESDILTCLPTLSVTTITVQCVLQKLCQNHKFYLRWFNPGQLNYSEKDYKFPWK